MRISKHMKIRSYSILIDRHRQSPRANVAVASLQVGNELSVGVKRFREGEFFAVFSSTASRLTESGNFVSGIELAIEQSACHAMVNADGECVGLRWPAVSE